MLERHTFWRIIGRQDDLQHGLQLAGILGHILDVCVCRVLGVRLWQVEQASFDGLYIQQYLHVSSSEPHRV